ncbi:MAG TPA: hypothetical protein VKV19_09815 [Ktedonobacteraceae bacterium]|jgi:hypothetical protein|nr:hypothetical protein [Ktedonobacteraceae bacterium]
MIAPRQSIFREKALKHYTQGKKKDILPNFSSIPATVFVWALLGSLIMTGLVSWYVQVPVYLPGNGFVLGHLQQALVGNNEISVLAFFPPNELAKLRAGQPVKILIDTNSPQMNGVVAQVLPEATTLATAFKHYGLNLGNVGSQTLQAVALIALSASLSTTLSTGSSVVIEVNTGTESMFSAISGLGN